MKITVRKPYYAYYDAPPDKDVTYWGNLVRLRPQVQSN